MLLAGDIGGTKTHLAVIDPEAGPRAPVAQKEFPSRGYPTLEAIVRAFLYQTDRPIDRACFAIAGPVIDGRVKTTNLPWVTEAETLRREFGLESVLLLNDLEAAAIAVPTLGPADLHTLSVGRPIPGGALAVIAPGTGLGEAFLTWDGSRYHAHASEGGHSDFAPADAIQDGLLQFMRRRFGHVSVERVCSGIGIPNIYDYLRGSGYATETPSVAAQLLEAKDRTPIIVDSGLDTTHPCPLCAATLDLFVKILGAEASNLALKVLGTAGVYLGGGIPPRVLTILKDGPFMEAFAHKGRYRELLSHVPVHVVLTRAALIGAAIHGLEARSST
ncbi:MAG: glk [Chloroflexi bacterium]|nr:glk [Chloroflexota bacterium]